MKFSPLAHWRLELHCHQDLGSLLKQCFESAYSKSIVFRSDFGVKPECKLCGLERKVCRFRNANVMESRHCTVLLFNAVSYNNVVNHRRSHVVQVTIRRRLGKIPTGLHPESERADIWSLSIELLCSSLGQPGPMSSGLTQTCRVDSGLYLMSYQASPAEGSIDGFREAEAIPVALRLSCVGLPSSDPKNRHSRIKQHDPEQSEAPTIFCSSARRTCTA
jgi:hypothetical protein